MLHVDLETPLQMQVAGLARMLLTGVLRNRRAPNHRGCGYHSWSSFDELLPFRNECIRILPPTPRPMPPSPISKARR